MSCGGAAGGHRHASTVPSPRPSPAREATTLRPGPEVPPIGDTLRREVTEGVPGWMHKPDLDVSTHAAFTRLQSWTLKPAVLR